MTIQEEIQAQCSFTREVDWCDLLARADACVRQPGLSARELDIREFERCNLYRVWRNLGSPASRVRWPSDITLADVRLRDHHSTPSLRVNAANTPNEVAMVWQACYVPVNSRAHLTQQTQWLPLLHELVQRQMENPGARARFVLASDDDANPQFWLELNQSGIKKLARTWIRHQMVITRTRIVRCHEVREGATLEMICATWASTCARRPRSPFPVAFPGARWSAASATCGRAADWRAPWSTARSFGSSRVAPIGSTPWPRVAGARHHVPDEPRAARRPPARSAATRRTRRRGWASIRVRCAVPCAQNLAARIFGQLQNFNGLSVFKSCKVSYRSGSVAIRPQECVKPARSVKKLL